MFVAFEIMLLFFYFFFCLKYSMFMIIWDRMAFSHIFIGIRLKTFTMLLFLIFVVLLKFSEHFFIYFSF